MSTISVFNALNLEVKQKLSETSIIGYIHSLTPGIKQGYDRKYLSKLRSTQDISFHSFTVKFKLQAHEITYSDYLYLMNCMWNGSHITRITLYNTYTKELKITSLDIEDILQDSQMWAMRCVDIIGLYPTQIIIHYVGSVLNAI